MKWLFSIPVILVAFVVVASLYLQPTDFMACGDKPSSDTACQTSDAIVVISGGDTAARTEAGIALYKNGWADRLIFSGAAQDTTGPSNATSMRQQALAEGVPYAAIIIDEDASNTHQNAENSMKILKENGYQDIILVTAGYHQRRANLEFHQQSADVEIRNHPVFTDKDWHWFWWATPRGWWLAGGEMVKIIAFHLGVHS